MGSSSSIKDDEDTKNAGSIYLNEADLGYREAFNILDVNGNHMISAKELMALYGSEVLGQEDTQQDFANDSNQNLDYTHFKQKLEDITKEQPLNKKIENSFSVFDRNGNGAISKNQIQYLLSSIGDPLTKDEVSEFMLEIDHYIPSRDGNVNYTKLAEFLCENENND